MDKVSLNDNTLSDIVILANTPAFMFKRFRRDSSVQILASRLSTPELANCANNFSMRQNRSFLDKVYAYAYLAALSFKPASDVRNELRHYPNLPIERSAELIKLILENAVSETYQIVLLTPQPSKFVGLHSQTSSTLSNVTYTTKPDIKVMIPINNHNERKVVHLD